MMLLKWGLSWVLGGLNVAQLGGSGMAVASILPEPGISTVVILTAFRIGLILGITALVLVVRSVRKGPDERYGVPALVLGCVGALAVAALTLAFANARENVWRSRCANNLKQMGLVLKMWSNDHRRHLPPLDPQRGRLIFNRELVFPEYLEDATKLTCPSDPDEGHLAGHEGGIELVDDHSYYYLGYVLLSEEEGLAFIDAYKNLGLPTTDAVRDAVELNEVIRPIYVPKGKGNLGESKIFPLTEDVGSKKLAWILSRRDPWGTGHHVWASSEIPIMWERPDNHPPDGGHVLYLDGHVEFVKMGEKFPISPGFLAALEDIAQD